MSRLYDLVRALPLEVDRYELEPVAMQTPAFERKTTVVHLHGCDHVGLGEDVTYDGDEHDRQIAGGAVLPLAGTWTLDSFSRHLATQPLFDHQPEFPAHVDYRRWAFESAALDLALRQAGTSLGAVVGREPSPVSFVVSGGLGDPPSTERIRRWLDLYPNVRFKLDARPTWDDTLLAELRELGCVDSIDFKGQYRGTRVDNPADVSLYRRVIEMLPAAWLEDPDLTPETIALLEPHRDRVTWDAIIHSVADIDALIWPPATLNLKPSRFGSIERLFAAYDACRNRGIRAYGGGQFELAVGRGQIQLLAALFHPDMPNDVAPTAYNAPEPTAGLPESPLTVEAAPTGFRAIA